MWLVPFNPSTSYIKANRYYECMYTWLNIQYFQVLATTSVNFCLIFSKRIWYQSLHRYFYPSQTLLQNLLINVYEHCGEIYDANSKFMYTINLSQLFGI